MEHIEKDLRYLRLLSKQFPSAASAASEIMNLQAILNLPKGTEHFLADIHGEYEAFIHVLKNASGTIRRKVNELFGGQIRENERRALCTLIYYPKESLERIHQSEPAMSEWYEVALNRLIKICQRVSEKYTRSKVQKALPPQYSYILQELLHEDGVNPNKSAYLDAIIKSIVDTGQADDFIIALSETIQRLAIDHLHIVGDIYDRGPGAHIIMDRLLTYHNVDIQWGNHDILWMGACVGNSASMANVVRIALRYANLNTLESGYGINLLPLARFAMETYSGDPCERFKPKSGDSSETFDDKGLYLISQMHKAIAIIQFKLEADIIARHPEYHMEGRNLLHLINKEAGTITLPDGKTYPLLDSNFPTIDPADPYKLTEGEADVVQRLMYSFQHSEKLRAHIRFMYKKGGMYLAFNRNLLFHASIPMTKNKGFKKVNVGGKMYSGRALMERVDEYARFARPSSSAAPEHEDAKDFMWYLWCGPDSPLFDKSAMTTLERYFIADKDTHKEHKGYYYVYRTEKEVCETILAEFGLEGPDTHIINGHVPVKAVKGEVPVQSGGKLMLIDGGFSRAYQSSTGIAGYTLIFNSHGLHLVKHEPFSSTKDAIEKMEDIESVSVVREMSAQRVLVRDTDSGKVLLEQVQELKKLLDAYNFGLLIEKA
ncbi:MULTISPECIES: fructose-bisphosphatase class III [unclassified Porphyromonas]|uniref:fructose-bisphosphatase class III n=1 Tax=unclassified Porphyromonas TaxID=2645799 RepID=UPI00052E0AFE|nr:MULTISPECIES: fructose-bisphosphatase class III [unclassified Porphyromonas]KGN83521.1 fructose 1,6-bisphosphatase [Porphyromonas sp. COT-290 OH860]KGN97873.1 fructose 1,6-bisphosphatase [Porphyromonas sp. COT-290 OH3588]